MRTMLKCNYGENSRNLSFPCTERGLQIFCDSLALPNQANAKIHIGRVHDNPQMDAFMAGKAVSLDVILEAVIWIKINSILHKMRLGRLPNVMAGVRL